MQDKKELKRMEFLCNILIFTSPVVDRLVTCMCKSDYCVYYPFLFDAEA